MPSIYVQTTWNNKDSSLKRKLGIGLYNPISLGNNLLKPTATPGVSDMLVELGEISF